MSDPRSTLESRIQAIEGDRALRNLMSQYAFYADSGQHDAWVDLFTPDGEIELVGGESTGTHPATARWAGTQVLHGRFRRAHVVRGPVHARHDSEHAYRDR